MVEQQRPKPNPYVHSILKSCAPLLYVSRFMGILPFSMSDFRKYDELRSSILSTLWCIAIVVIHCGQYYFATVNSLNQNWGGDTNTLVAVIGVFIVSMEPIMMTVGVLMNVYHQRSFISCMNRLGKVDEQLQVITSRSIPGKKVKRLTIILISGTFICEIGLVLFNFMQFQISDNILLQTYWWVASGLPIYSDANARLWYLVLMFMVKLRLKAVNEYCCELQNTFKEKKDKYGVINARLQTKNTPPVSIGYLGQEISDPKKRGAKKVIFVKPNKIHVQSADTHKDSPIFVTQKSVGWSADDAFLVEDKMDKKLMELARIHDELCEIAKLINHIFNFQILLTMAYGFMSVTAQLYFLYCGLAGQVIPILFRSAESITISMIYITYTSAKCVSIILISWKTKTEAQKTGIFFHKMANVIDENHFYQVVNHLSLKLLNNQLSLTACGFFELDMTTIYAVSEILMMMWGCEG